MASSADKSWSVLQAAGIFLKAGFGDLIWYESLRRGLLAKLWITQKRFKLNGRETSYLLASQTKDLPPVLFLHGTPGNALDWAWFLKKAASRLSIFALDRPGFGVVDKKPPVLEQDIETLREALALAFEHGEKVVVVGHSLGGGLAAKLAAEYPEMVKGLVLVGASLDPGLKAIHPIQRHAARAPLSWLLPRSVRNCNIELLQYPEFLNALQPDLEEISCPVTVIHSRNDRLVPYRNVDYVQKYFSNVASLNVVTLDRGGHFLNKSRPRLLLEAIETLI